MSTKEDWNKNDAELASEADLLRQRLIEEEAKAAAAHEPAKPFSPRVRDMMAESFHDARQRAYQPQRDFSLTGSEPDSLETVADDEPKLQPKPASRPRKGVGTLTGELEE